MIDHRVIKRIREAKDKNLTELNLSDRSLSQLPKEIGSLKNLIALDLSENPITQLPIEIIGLKKLKKLSLSGNGIAGLPKEIRLLSSLTELDLSNNRLTQLPSEISTFRNLTKLDLSNNLFIQIPMAIYELKNLKKLDISKNQLSQLSHKIGELKNLTTLDLSSNRFVKLPWGIGELRSLTELNISQNQLTQLPSEISRFKNLSILNLAQNNIGKLPQEIAELSSLTELDLSNNHLTQLPSGISAFKNLKRLDLSRNQLIRLPQEIGELSSLMELDLSQNQLTQLPSEITKFRNLSILNLAQNKIETLPQGIGELRSLIELNLSQNQLTDLPLEFGNFKHMIRLDLSNNSLIKLPLGIGKMRSLKELDLFHNALTQLPSEICELKNLTKLELSGNSLTSPPPEIVSRGMEAIITYLEQSKTTENNEAKLILVGNGEVGKTCLARRLTTGKFVEDKITEGINISKWVIPAPDSETSNIQLNIWDFGGQEIYHATHQFFLTKRSVYILVWNARKTKDYDHIYYWLHTIEAFGEDSPIILVMSKMNECNDDLNLKDLKGKFPMIVDYLKIDSLNGRGINNLTETIRKTAWELPLMRTNWVDSWFKVRQRLEELRYNWITYGEFYKICKSNGLDTRNINVLDDYLNDLGVTLHFKDRLALKDIVILKPDWATNAFYKILSAKFVLENGGVLQYSELSQIWDMETYPSSIYSQLMELMNKFELAYELPDKKSFLVAELLPKNEPDFIWDEKDNLCFYYCYNYFLPSSIITRFIVRMHQDIEKNENGMPLCWREGAVMKLQNSRAIVKMKPDERQIEIKIKGENKRGALGAICNELDRINASIKKISVNKEVPCNCVKNCPWRYPYEKLLKAEMNNVNTIQCFESYKHVQISLLLDGYKKRDERRREYHKLSGNQPVFVISPTAHAHSEANPITNAVQKTNVKQEKDVDIAINIDINIVLPQIQTDFYNLRNEITKINPELKSEMDEIQDSLDEVSADDGKEKLKKPFNKLRRFLFNLGDPNSEYNKIISGTQKGAELAQKAVDTFNKVAPAIGILALHGLH